MQDCQFVLSRLLPVCNLQLLFVKTVLLFFLWCFTLNFVNFKFIDTLKSQSDNFIFLTPTFVT